MIKTIKRFDRGNGLVCVVDTRSGERVVTYERNGKPVAPKSPEVMATTKPKKPPRRIQANNRRAAQGATAPKPKPPRPNRTDCIHFLGAIGEYTAHLCGGCKGNQQTTVCDCELHGRCAPLAWAPVPDKSVRRCVDCGSYSPPPVNSAD